MKKEWTKEQKEVLDARNSSLLVSAAAGSGKTAVLSSRIVSLLTDKEHPLEIDRILVVTFTNLAAAEMRERIAEEIQKALEQDPKNRHLKKQAALVHHAKITTIDSFCLYILRNYALKIGLPGALSVGDTGEMTLLASEAMDRLMEEVYEEKDPAALSFITAYRSTRSDQQVRDMIQRTAGFSESFPWPEQWLMEAGKAYEGEAELLQSPLMQAFTASVSAELRSMGEELKLLSELSVSPGGPAVYAALLEKEGEQLLSWGGTYAKLWEEVTRFKADRLPAVRKSDDTDPQLKEYIKGKRDKIKEKINKIKDRNFAYSPEEMLFETMKAGNHVRTLISLTLRFREIFAQKKREKNLVDFSDIEHFALQILVDPETHEPTDTARMFAGMYDEIMVDEYQDSNFVQEEILKAISGQEKGEHHLFMVGDVKQSIYRFRQARPQLFMEKYRRFQREGVERKIDLHKNFRSRAEILSPVNRIFYRLMGEDLGHIPYNEEAALFAGASFKEPEDKTFCSFLLMEDTGEEKDILDAESNIALEERLIAKKIKELIRNVEITDKNTGELRPCRYSDIAILLRSPGKIGGDLIEELKKDGIPAVFTQTAGFFDAPEVASMLNLLRIIDNPMQDIPLAGVLLSPIGGFSEEELASVVIEEKEEEPELSFCECVLRSPKTEDFREKLERFRRLATWLPVHELMDKIFAETGFLSYEAALPGGEQREANLRMLMEKAAMYEEGKSLGLYRFIRMIENLQKYEADFGEAELMEENTDAVRILSIHKSKGLEYPVVFLAGTGKIWNRSDEKDRLLLSPEYGLGLMNIDAQTNLKSSNFPHEAISWLTREEENGEELRVLYVALTRAKERLFITGVKKNLGDQWEGEKYSEEGRDGKLLSYEKRISANCYLDWLLPAAACDPGSDEFNVFILSPEELKTEREQEETEDLHSLLTLKMLLEKTEQDQALSERMNFCYPYEGEERVTDKISVTELKHRAMLLAEDEGASYPGAPETEKKKESPVPWFAKEKEEKDPTQRGMAFHRMMECMDLSIIKDLDTLPAAEQKEKILHYVKELEEEGLLSSEWAALIEPELKRVLNFLKSDLAKAMQKADEAGKLYREKPFVMGLEAGRIYGTDSTETVIIQGIIDAFFYEGEGITILDYKTDRVKKEEELKNKYNIQLKLYREAVERVTGCKNIKTVLYSFALDKTIEIKP